MAMTKVKNLQLWCKKMAEGYRDVEVRDMASSWKSGLAFCAIIHRFRPDLIDYDSLSKENVFENNNLAFEVAEKELKIPAFLEAQDMVAIRVPDKLSVVTYVSQYYSYFHNKPQLGGPGVNEFKKGGKKKDAFISSEQKTLTPTHMNTGKTEIQKDRQESMGDKCSICHEKVYLLERHIENAKLYHRSCYRRSELSPQSRLSKRQNERVNGEESKDMGKLRKLNQKKNDSGNQSSSSGQDFWQRRAEAKAKGDSNAIQNSNSEMKINEVPSWKKTDIPAKSGDKNIDTNNDVVMQSPKSKAKFDKGDNTFSHDKQIDSGARPNKLADKFKELNERNLKSSQADQNAEKSNDKRLITGASGDFKLPTSRLATDIKKADTGEQKTPVAKPRQNVLQKDEKMDTSESTGSRPRPVPRFKVKVPGATDQDKNSAKSNEMKKESPRTKPPTTSSDISLPAKTQDHSRPKTPPFKHKVLSKAGSPKQKPQSPKQRAKSPKQRTKSEISFDSVSKKENEDLSPSLPPPLPTSVPPTLPASSAHQRTSPTPSPRQPFKKFTNEASEEVLKRKQYDKSVTGDTKGVKIDNMPPSKPPRISTNLIETNKKRDITPMETDTFAPAKAVFHDPEPDQKAFLSQPKRHNISSDKDRDLVGGLLKSLADVRNKHDVEMRSVDKSNVDKNHEPSQSNVAKENLKVNLKDAGKKSGDETAVKVSNKPPQRPKSSFVSGRADVFLQDVKSESHSDKNKSDDDIKLRLKTNVTEKTIVTTKTTTTVVDNDIPAWKKQLEERKAEQQRPKSVDILSHKTDDDDKPEWQKEAEKRMLARKGGYTDPEKVKIADTVIHPSKIADKNTNSTDLANKNTNNLAPAYRPLSPPQKTAVDVTDKFVPPKTGRDSPVGKDKIENKVDIKEKRRILPVAPGLKDVSPPRTQEDKKKISVGQRFVFEDIDVTSKKPQQPSGPQKSPGPPRPPQPTPVNKRGKHHMSAYQIQRELEKIDDKLTDLELKGRNLEDAIRKAREEEEDDLMIDWFRLVSDKNELVRQEADIIYLSRAQELEAEQTLVEQQLRELVDKPDLDKSTEEQQEEEYLMNRFLDIVNQRSNIVDSMDEDRLRYLAEDKDIEQMLKDKAFKIQPVIEVSKQSSKKSKKGKWKGKRLGLGFTKDKTDGKLKKDKKKSKLL